MLGVYIAQLQIAEIDGIHVRELLDGADDLRQLSLLDVVPADMRKMGTTERARSGNV